MEIKTNIERLNELTKSFEETSIKITLMNEFGDIDQALLGVNEDGEEVLLSINPDCIVVSTNQSNGWIRQDYYNEDGEYECETYEGKWK